MVSTFGETENVLRLLKVDKEEPGNVTEKGQLDIGNIRREKWFSMELQILCGIYGKNKF